LLFLVTAISAIVPSLLLIWYFWARDVQREPGRVLWATFGFGVLSIIPTLMVEIPVGMLLKRVHDPIGHGALEAFFVAAGPEEFFKLLVLLLYCDRQKEFDEPMDGIVYGAAASIGFATLENVLYVAGGGLGLALIRALTAVPGHAFLGAILGYHVGQAKFFPARRWRLILTGYAMAFVLHGLYDFPLLAKKHMEAAKAADGVGPLLLITLAALLFEWVWVVRQVRRLRVDQLHVVAVRAVMAGQAPPPGVLTAAPPTVGAKVGAWVRLIAGALFATGGGLVMLVMAFVTLAAPESSHASRSNGAAAAGMFGLLPLVIGVVLFATGIRRLGPRQPLSPYVQRAAR
jgi:RsiW-degrading membrane proteinase PrsW (M82 family)